MNAWRAWFVRFSGLFGKDARDRELDAELQSHLEMHVEDNLRAGMNPEEARRQALITLGGVEQTKETYRERRGIHWLETLLQDVRFGLRILRKNPGFTAVAVLTLALGIGANTAIYSVIDAVLIHPLPFASPDRLIWLNGKMPMSDMAAVSPPDFLDYRANNRSFEHMGAMGYYAAPVNLVGGRSEQVLADIVSAGFFDTLGIRPLLGREFSATDEQVATSQVAILGQGIWRAQFGADPGVIGRSIRIDGNSVTIVGVLPTDLPLLAEAQIWLPTPFEFAPMKDHNMHFLKVIGRLKPGVTLQQSQSDLDAIANRIAREYPNSNEGWTLRQRPLREVLIGPVNEALLMIWGAVGLLLLVACVNVANLLLARAASRQREFAVRSSLGASRGRLVRQTLTEGALLAIWAGVFAAVLAWPCIHALRAIGPKGLPRLADVHMNADVLLFTAGISLLTVTIFGLAPALLVSGSQFRQGLKESGRGSISSSHKHWSNFLVIAEIAMSFTLLIGAGLLLKSFWKLVHVNPGFETSHVITAMLSLNSPAYNDARRVQFWREFEERASSLPGVEAFGATSELPLNGIHSDDPFEIEGHVYKPAQEDDANFHDVTPGYFSAMRVPLLAGRVFNEEDTETSPGVVVVNRAFATRFFRGTDALGKRLHLLGDPLTARTIVGIVGNISSDALSEIGMPEMYVPYSQHAASGSVMHFVIRASADPGNLSQALRQIVASLDPDEAVSGMRSMDDVFSASVSQPRFTSQILALSSGLALFLAAIGLYGLIAYSVSQRTNELGIRIALGASRKQILALILKHGVLLAVAGLAIGFVASFFAARLLASQLFEIEPGDPQIFIGVTALLAAVALAAGYIPARRATKVDPMVALRYE